MDTAYYRRGAAGQSRGRSRGRSPGIRGGGGGGRGRSGSNSRARSNSNSRVHPNQRSDSGNRNEQRQYHQQQQAQYQRQHLHDNPGRDPHNSAMWASREDYPGGGGTGRQERPSRSTSRGRNYNQRGAYGSSSVERRAPRLDVDLEYRGARARAPYASTNNAYGIIPPPEGMYPQDSGRRDEMDYEYEYPERYSRPLSRDRDRDGFVSSSFPEDRAVARIPRSYGHGAQPQGAAGGMAIPNPNRGMAFPMPRERSPSPRPPTPPPASIIGPNGAIKNHVEIVVLSEGLQEFAEIVEADVKAQGYKADLMFPKTDVKLSAFLNNIANSGTIFALVVRTDNPPHNSVSVHVLRPAPQEHRNMPLETAYALMKAAYKNYRRHELGEVPPKVRTSMKLILNDQSLTDMEYQGILQYVQNRWHKQRALDRRTDFDPGTGISTSEELKQKILKIMLRPDIPYIGDKGKRRVVKKGPPPPGAGGRVPRDPSKPPGPGTNQQRPPGQGPFTQERSESSQRPRDPSNPRQPSSRASNPNMSERPKSSRPPHMHERSDTSRQSSNPQQEHRGGGESSQFLRNPFQQQQYQDSSFSNRIAQAMGLPTQPQPPPPPRGPAGAGAGGGRMY